MVDTHASPKHDHAAAIRRSLTLLMIGCVLAQTLPLQGQSTSEAQDQDDDTQGQDITSFPL